MKSKFAEWLRLRGVTLNALVPMAIWGLSATNAVLAIASVWTGSGRWSLVAVVVTVAILAIRPFVAAAALLRDHATAPTRVLVGTVLLGGSVGAAWLNAPAIEWGRSSEEAPKPSVALAPASSGDAQPFVPAGPERLEYVPENVMELITQARRGLGAMTLDVSKCGGQGAGALACRGDYIVAVTDAKGAIEYVTIYQGKEASKPGYTVELGKNGRATGVNPDIVVTHPPGVTVLAIRTAIDWAGTATWAVYVPYSREINTPEVRAAGVAYLWRQVTKARDDLRQARVRSQFFDEPGSEVGKKGRVKRLVADVVPADHVFTLVLTENVTHPEPFTAGGSNARRLELLNEALAQLGANQSKAWDFRASSVGARGKGQFMPKTYATLCAAYPIDCPKDHAVGARDDGLTFRLMFLHADDEWRGIRNRDWLMGQPMLMRLYLSAGYNSFYGNGAGALRTCGVAHWRNADCMVTRTKGKGKKKYTVTETGLPPETRPYLDKYEWIYGQHFDAKSHDAVAAEVYPNATVETTPDADVPDDETKTE